MLIIFITCIFYKSFFYLFSMLMHSNRLFYHIYFRDQAVILLHKWEKKNKKTDNRKINVLVKTYFENAYSGTRKNVNFWILTVRYYTGWFSTYVTPFKIGFRTWNVTKNCSTVWSDSLPLRRYNGFYLKWPILIFSSYFPK